MKIETNRLLITPLLESDRDNYFYNISNDKEVLKTFICTYCEKLEEFDFSKYMNRDDIFAIRFKDNNQLIGIISIFDNKNNSLEIGYGIGSKYWNNGYVTEAVQAFIDYLFNNSDIKTIFASYFKGNESSRRVMEKCGMKYSHTNEKELEYLGSFRDLIYFRIDK